MLTLNGRPGMVFIEDHPASRLNLNVGIYLDDAAPADAHDPGPRSTGTQTANLRDPLRPRGRPLTIAQYMAMYR